MIWSRAVRTLQVDTDLGRVKSSPQEIIVAGLHTEIIELHRFTYVP